MNLAELTARVDAWARRSTSSEHDSERNAPADLLVYRSVRRTEFEAMVYQPLMCLILQGKKETTIGDRRFLLGSGQQAIVSHHLPVTARIIEASPDAPYLALIARLDLPELRRLQDELGDVDDRDDDPSSAYAIAPIDAVLLDLMTRYVGLWDEPDAIGVLEPLLRRELHYRLLTADNGGMLRRLLQRDSHESKIARALAQLRRDYPARLEVAALARSVGMSVSSFHKHFKQVTATTPLQYQKDLRLTEARRLLVAGGHTVSTAAFEVGYESATQFSREFSRKFGAPPRSLLRPGSPPTSAPSSTPASLPAR